MKKRKLLPNAMRHRTCLRLEPEMKQQLIAHAPGNCLSTLLRQLAKDFLSDIEAKKAETDQLSSVSG